MDFIRSLLPFCTSSLGPRRIEPAQAFSLAIFLFTCALLPSVLGVAAQAQTETTATAASNLEKGGDIVDLWVYPRSIGSESQSAIPELVPSDVTVRLDGEVVPVEFIAPGAPAARRQASPWQIVLYFDHSLAGESTLRRAALAFTEAARQLTDLGSVEVVRAQPDPRISLPATQDSLLLDSALSQSVIRAGQLGEEQDRDALRKRRQQFQRQVERLREQNRVLDSPAATTWTDHARQAMEQEQALLRRQLDHLLAWVASRPLPEPGQRRLLFWITDGFDQDPERFYLDGVPSNQAEALRRSGGVPDFSAWVLDVARTLSAYGWTTVPVVFGSFEVEAANTRDSYEDFEQAARDDAPTAAPWVSVSLESLRRRLRGEEETSPANDSPVLLDALAPMRTVASTTGGRAVTDGRQLIPLIERLPYAWTLRVALPRSARGGASAEVVPHGAPDRGDSDRGAPERGDRRESSPWTTRSWVASSPPETVAAARVRRLLQGQSRGELIDGQLEILSSLQLETDDGQDGSRTRRGVLEASADLTPLSNAVNASNASNASGVDAPERAQTRLRLTYGLASADGATLRLLHETREVGGLVEQGDWRVERQVELPPGTDRVVVLLEDLESSAWGGSVAAMANTPSANPLAEAADAAARSQSDPSLLARPKAVRLIAPDQEVLRGRVSFQARVQSSIVERVVFFLDGEQVAEVDSPPYEARIRLGNLPARRTLWAVGYGPAGQEVGRDILLINDAGGNFRVFLTQPTALQPGPTDVAVDVSVPVGRRLDRVELSWNDQLLATLYGPPLRQRVVLPSTEGFLRAAAFLDDGRMAEDVLLPEDPDFAERVSIRLVELYTVVTDADGKPVQGLDADDFVVLENGRRQAIQAFEDAGQLPLTLGLAVDSSASMFVKLPAVQQAAGDFVRAVLTERDRAFLVDYDTDPRLTRELGSDLDRLVTGIDSLEANGDSDLWEAIVFSLLELQAERGKKALVLFSDGAVEDEEMPFRTCLELAQRAGVPIYLIVLHPGVARGDDLSLGMRNFTGRLKRLSEASGGQVYYLPNTRNLASIYQDIERELRSQYLLGYYPADPEDEDSWREVEVELPNHPGLRARTIAGYFPQL